MTYCDDVSEWRVNFESADQDDVVHSAGERLEFVTRPAVVLGHHYSGESQAPGVLDHLFGGQSTVRASLIRVNVEVEYGRHSGRWARKER